MYAEIKDGEIRQTIDDGAPVCLADGTQFPGNFPKEEITPLVRVGEAARPDDCSNLVGGRDIQLIDGTPTEIWQSRPKTDDELKAARNDVRRAAIANLEAQQSDRRLREAMLGTEAKVTQPNGDQIGWMADLDRRIAAIRASLEK